MMGPYRSVRYKCGCTKHTPMASDSGGAYWTLCLTHTILVDYPGNLEEPEESP